MLPTEKREVSCTVAEVTRQCESSGNDCPLGKQLNLRQLHGDITPRNDIQQVQPDAQTLFEQQQPDIQVLKKQLEPVGPGHLPGGQQGLLQILKKQPATVVAPRHMPALHQDRLQTQFEQHQKQGTLLDRVVQRRQRWLQQLRQRRLQRLRWFQQRRQGRGW